MRLREPLAAACLAAVLLTGAPGTASATVPPPGSAPAVPDPAVVMPVWERAAYKTLTFQTAAMLGDVVLFAVISGSGTATGVAFLAANVASATALYYPYESAWEILGPPPSETTAATRATKTLAYEVLTSARNVALSYAFTGLLLPSAGFAAAAFAMDTVLYAANDLAWDALVPRAEP